jgi:voltage-gated potassium channel
MAPPVPAKMPRSIERVLTSRHVFARLIFTTVALTILFGVLISLVDRKEFPSVWLGMWWAIQTVTTLGYGDIVPTQITGRLLAAATMIVGIGFLSLITATVASVLVSRATQNVSSEEADLMTALKRVEQRLESLEQELRSGGRA